MTMFFLRLLVLLTTADFSLSQWSIDGTTQTFTFVTDKRVPDVQIYWVFNNGSKNFTYFMCSTSYGIVCIPYQDTITEFFSAQITSNSTSFISVFTIKIVNISLHRTQWFCSADFRSSFTESARFDLHVFALATSPTCDEATLVNESHIQINCGTKKVFPASMCLFILKTNVSSEYALKQGDTNYTHEQNLTSLYYKTTCTLVVSAALLGPGSHIFRVVMYPNITSNITEDMKTTSNNTSSIYFAYPKVVLGTDCDVNSYIKENEKRNCTCYDSSNSLLPTQIIWSTNQTFILDKRTMIFTAKRKESFQCKISNHLNWTDSSVFQPNISYPPDIVKLNITKQIFDLCNDTDIAISGTCFVSESNPEPSIIVNINNSLMDITSLKHNRVYMFNMNVTHTGMYYISCNANSMEYSKNTSSTTTVKIKGPPDIPTIFKNEDKESEIQPKKWLEITKGDTLTCQAKGGYPTSKNVSLKCGLDEKTATNQDQVSQALNISIGTNATCQCVVWHESVCLQNTTTVQFNVIAPFTDESTADLFSDGAICGVVIAGIVVVASIVLIIFIVRRYKGKKVKNPRRKTQNETHDYDHMSASQYVNAELHAYETSHTKTNYVNVVPTPAKTSDLPTISLKQASTQYLNTEIGPYETAEGKNIYSNEESIIDIVNAIDGKEYDTVNDQAENCYDEITDTNVTIDAGSK